MKIYILRHCKTNYNTNNKWCGCKSDVDLSEEGMIRNDELIDELSKINFDVIYTSPLKRCFLTASKLSNLTNTKLVVDERLIERDFGELEGKECSHDDKLSIADFDLNTDLGKGVEKINDLYNKRVIPFYNDLVEKKDEKILIVTHSWIVRLSKFYFDEKKDEKIVYDSPKNGEYIVFELNKMISRNFNYVTVNGNKLTKRSSYTKKFNDEIHWMTNLPKELIEYIPKIYEYFISDSKNNESFITMEYIKEKSFDQIYLNNKISEKDVVSFFSKIKMFLLTTSKYKSNYSSDKIEKMQYNIYFQKTIDRWNEIKDSKPFNLFYENPFFINGIQYKPIKNYLQKLDIVLDELRIIDGQRSFCIIHGDLCFNNIIFHDNKMYLVDPRGSFGISGIYGDQLYELAKILHSISGYDAIINNQYEININKNNLKYKIYDSENKNLFLKSFKDMFYDQSIFKKVCFIESLLFLSMIPLHNENYEHQIIMMCMAIEKISKFIC